MSLTVMMWLTPWDPNVISPPEIYSEDHESSIFRRSSNPVSLPQHLDFSCTVCEDVRYEDVRYEDETARIGLHSLDK